MWGLWWTERHWGRFSTEYFSFPYQSFHQFLHHHNYTGAGTIGFLVAAVPSGPNWTPPPSIPIFNRTLGLILDDDDGEEEEEEEEDEEEEEEVENL
jgi:hypothetical protein